jgi:hypothetical protein
MPKEHPAVCHRSLDHSFLWLRLWSFGLCLRTHNILFPLPARVVAAAEWPVSLRERERGREVRRERRKSGSMRELRARALLGWVLHCRQQREGWEETL